MIVDFTLQQELLNKGISVALAYPYTYSRMNKLLKDVSDAAFLEGLPEEKMRIKNIGESILGMSIWAIEFNREGRAESPTKSRSQTKSVVKIKRPLKVVIIARQHPSETVGSYICEFLIKRLVLNALKQTNKSF